MNRAVAGGAIAVAMVATAAAAQTSPRSTTPATPVEEVVVTANGELEDGSTIQSGGTYVVDQSFGPLGAVNARDLPYSTNSIPQRLILDQQAKSLLDVLRNDPGTAVVQGNAGVTDGGSPKFSIRGFTVDFGAVRVNGQNAASITPPPEGIERVDVLKGSTAVLYGFGVPAGVINVVTKQPLDQALTRLTLQSVMNNGQFEGALDTSRRFGSEDQFGIRVNLAREGGDTPVDLASIDRDFEQLALDWKPVAGLRVWLSYFHAYQKQQGIEGFNYTAGGASLLTHVPAPPDASSQLGQPWAYQSNVTDSGQVGFDYKQGPWRAGFAYGENHTRNGLLTSNTAYDDTETTNVQPLTDQYREVAASGSGYVGVDVRTGFVSQALTAAFTSTDYAERYSNTALGPILGQSNIQHPSYFPLPAPLPTLPIVGESRFVNQSLILTDKVSFGPYFDVIGGLTIARYKTISGGQQRAHANTPMAAGVFKPVSWLNAYVSYAESLQVGRQAPRNAANFFEFLAPFRGRQLEEGLKISVRPGLEATLAHFDVDQAYAFLDPNDNVYKSSGSQDNEGEEFTLTGKVFTGLTVTAGYLHQDERVVDVAGLQVGNPFNTVTGYPHDKANLYVEYALPQVKGLTLFGNVQYVGSEGVFFRGGALAEYPDYVIGDLGAAYRLHAAGRAYDIRFYAQNIANEHYWNGSYFGGVVLSLGDPRTFKLAISTDF